MECIDKNNVDELKRRWMEEGLVCIQNAFERHDDMRLASACVRGS